MAVCKIYCDSPQTEVSKCEALETQIIRMHTGTAKTIRLSIIKTCIDNDTSESTDMLDEVIPNTGSVPNIYTLSTVELPTYSFTVTDTDGTTKQTGSGSIRGNYTAKITLNALTTAGYYRLHFTTTIHGNVSTCAFPIVVCS